MPGVLSLAHLSLVDLTPPELVAVADAAGFGHVGLRLSPARDDEPPWPMTASSPMLRETRARLGAAGVAVLDVEVLRLTPDVDVDAFAPVLEVAAVLGARFAVVSGFDDDELRLVERFAALCALAAPLGVRPMLEPMAYSSVSSFAQADRIVTRAGSAVGGVLVDAIHLRRTGAAPEDLAAIAPERLGYLQLNDAPLAPPAGGLDAIARESRQDRLPPGEGELPLAELLRVTPAGRPISVEAPSDARRARLGDVEHARGLRRAAETLLTDPTNDDEERR